MSRERSPARSDWLVIVLLVLAAVIPFLPAVRGAFQWDDEELHIQPAATAGSPLVFFGAGGADETHAVANYYPLSMLGFWCEYRVFGKSTAGYHVVNLALHAGNVLLVWWLLKRMRVPWAGAVAGVFAVHPMMVETVAYVSELKNLLSGVFFLGAAHLWMTWRQAKGGRAVGLYVGVLVCFVAAMLAKSTACTFPVVVLLMDWMQEGRVGKRSVAGAIPLVAIGAAVAGVFIHAEHGRVGASGSAFAFSLVERVLIASRAAWFYMGKFVVPWPLLTVYPRWRIDAGAVWQWGFLAGGVGALAGLWGVRKRVGVGPLAGALMYLVLIGPSLGLVVYYPMVFTFVADHYLYLGAVPLAGLFVGVVRWVVMRAGAVRWMEVAVGGVLALALVPVTLAQAARWRTAVGLWEPTVEGNPGSWYATANLGYAYAQAGKFAEAREMAERSLKLNGENSRAYFTLGLSLLQLEDPAGAAAAYQRGLALEGTNAAAWLNDGIALERLGNDGGAAAAYGRAAALDRGMAKAWNNLAVLQMKHGDWERALGNAEEAVRADAAYGPGYVNLAVALEHAGKAEEAVGALRRAEVLLGASPRLEWELVRLLMEEEDTAGAAEACRKLIVSAPASAEAGRARALLGELQGKAPGTAAGP